MKSFIGAALTFLAVNAKFTEFKIGKSVQELSEVQLAQLGANVKRMSLDELSQVCAAGCTCTC